MSQTHHSSDAKVALETVRGFLGAEPVKRNVFLTLLAQRVDSPEPGHYWSATWGDRVDGFAFQSPLDRQAMVAVDEVGSVDVLAQAVFETNPELPGISGEVATAARFAGLWTELSGGSAEPTDAQRLYELDDLVAPHDVPGRLRFALPDDAETVAGWHVGFCADTGMDPVADPLLMAKQRIEAQRVWIWEVEETVSMAMATPSVADASRIAHVFTPPEERGRGYGGAVVAGVSAAVSEQGTSRCLLYTQLTNATSNSIYRSIGYRPVEERLTYRFSP